MICYLMKVALEQGKFFNNKFWNALKLLKMWEGSRTARGESAVTEIDSNSFAINWFENRLNEVRSRSGNFNESIQVKRSVKNYLFLNLG